MKRILLSVLFVFVATSLAYAQVKIGDKPSNIHPSSILELNSADKVLVITRVDDDTQMNAITPLHGALVYNESRKCVFIFNGTNWRSLCATNTIVNTGAPNATTAPNPQAGDMYIDKSTGIIYAYDGTTWVNSNLTIKATNGITLNPTTNTLSLGGSLTTSTVIETNGNTFGVKDLKQGDIAKEDFVTVDRSTGEFKKVSSSSFFGEEVAVIEAKKDGAKQFSPPLPISDSKKVNVYRNGVRIDFKVIDNTTIEVEPEAVCYEGDQIRIVQFY